MQTTTRQPYIDWLRTIAIIGVLLFHSAMAFVAEEWWHIKDKETSNLLLEFNFWLSRFRMPLLFFISGAVSYYMLQKKSGWGFAGLRFRRLFVPLLFGMLVVVPPQVYMERLTQGFQGNFFDFYPAIFEGKPYPAGNTSWHHLWFILYLFIYDLIATPFFVWCRSEKAGAFRQKLLWLAKSKRIYLLLIPSAAWYVATVFIFPRTNDLIHDWSMFVYWFLFLLVGYIVMINPALVNSLERNRRTSLMLAFLSLITLNYLRWNGLEPWDTLGEGWRGHYLTWFYMALYPLTAWSWVLTAVGYGKKYLNKKHNTQDYINQAVYPFYILHQTVIVIIVYYVVQVRESILAKYLFTVALSFAISMAIFHLFIRPYAITRFLFGMKPKRKRIHEEKLKEETASMPVAVNAAI